MSIFTYTIPKFDQAVKARNVAILYAMQEVEGKPWNGGTISQEEDGHASSPPKKRV
ncbi:MAG: hypothetical protein ACOX2U_03800 [Limisphaerales bacterium]|jgi:hypothetical protein